MYEDPFKEYLRYTEASKREKVYAWQTAIGLQDVDGLKPSTYLIETSHRNILGEITLDEAESLIYTYYKTRPEITGTREEEADKVSVRIAKIISEPAFSFTVTEYLSIHRYLFDGIYLSAGKIRTYNITKKEWVLDGNTVTYGRFSELMRTLEYDINKEKNFSYENLSRDEMVSHLARFIANLWQIHIFEEGNTRTTAVFFIKYLRILGFDVTNEIFAMNAWYFRNALVRANYTDLSLNIHETTEYLEVFIRNLLFGEENILKNRYMHIFSEKFNLAKQDIGEAKQDIGEAKQDIGEAKQDIERLKIKLDLISDLRPKSKENILSLYQKLEMLVFSRKDLMKLLNITASPASDLIKKMLKNGLITPVSGQGKGKYIFKF